MKSIKRLVRKEMMTIPTQGFRLRKGRKIISKILPKTKLKIHISKN